RLDKYGNIHMDRERLSVPGGGGGQLVFLKVYWDRVEVMDEAHETIAVLPRPSSLKQQEIDWVQALEQVKNKPRAVPYTVVYSALPKTLKRYLGIADLSHR